VQEKLEWQKKVLNLQNRVVALQVAYWPFDRR